MQQHPPPNAPAAPSFWQVVFGTMLGNLGCLLVYLLLTICVLVFFGALLGPQIGNIFSRITPDLGPQ